MALKLGVNAKLYYLSTGTRASWGSATNGVVSAAAPSNLAEIKIVKDMTVSIEKNEADVTTRTSDWDAFKGTTKALTIEIPAINDVSNAGVAALRTAFLGDDTIALAVLDGDKATEGSEGVWADFEVLKMERGEPLKGEQTLMFTVKPAYSAVPPEWVRIPAA